MESSQVIVWMIIACIAFLAFLLFTKPAKIIGRMIVQGAVGGIGFYLINFLLSPFNISVGINFLTIFIVGILGIPGFVTLYLANLFL